MQTIRVIDSHAGGERRGLSLKVHLTSAVVASRSAARPSGGIMTSFELLRRFMTAILQAFAMCQAMAKRMICHLAEPAPVRNSVVLRQTGSLHSVRSGGSPPQRDQFSRHHTNLASRGTVVGGWYYRGDAHLRPHTSTPFHTSRIDDA